MLLLSPLGRDVATLTNHIIQIANPMVAQPSRPHTLIAGGAGFIGSHLCERFLEDGHRVTCVDNLLTGRLENVDHLLDRTDFTFLHQDISAQLDVGTDFDYILNFACPASPIDYLKFPLETLAVGSTGMKNLLDIAAQCGARILQASTSEVYGDPLTHPQTEAYWGNVNPIGPRSVYDESKRFAEAIMMAYHRERGVETRLVRIFNTYGPRMRLDDGRVLPTFMKQALSDEPISIFGDGSQTRSFCFVDDLVEGIVRLLYSDEVQPVNLGNPQEITIGTFAEEVVALTNSSSTISYHPLPEDDPKVRCPDITRAFEVLGWTPSVEREDGLAMSLDYFIEEVGKLSGPRAPFRKSERPLGRMGSRGAVQRRAKLRQRARTKNPRI